MTRPLLNQIVHASQFMILFRPCKWFRPCSNGSPTHKIRKHPRLIFDNKPHHCRGGRLPAWPKWPWHGHCKVLSSTLLKDRNPEKSTNLVRPRLKTLMRDHQVKFLDNHHEKSVDDLWSDFTSTIDSFAAKCIPSKQIQGKTSQPRITQICRLIRQRNDLYRKFKRTSETRHIEINSYPSEKVSNIKSKYHIITI